MISEYTRVVANSFSPSTSHGRLTVEQARTALGAGALDGEHYSFLVRTPNYSDWKRLYGYPAALRA